MKLRPFFILFLLAITIQVAGQQKTITVGYGETFETIAVQYGISKADLLAANPGKKNCYAGMKMIIPEARISPVGLSDMSSRLVNISDSLLILAKNVRDAGEYKEAIHLYNKVIDMNVRRAYGYAGRGECYYDLKKYKKAKSDLTTAIYSGELAQIEKSWCEDALEEVEEALQEKREKRNRIWQNIGLAAATTAAVATTAYMAAEQSKAQNNYYQSSPTYSGSGSSHLSRADAIIAQSNAQIDQQMMQGTTQLNQMTQQMMVQAQQHKARMDLAFKDELKWAGEFYEKNGRKPTDYETDQWYSIHYPDLLDGRIQARGKMASNDSDTDSRQSEREDKYNPTPKTRATSSRDCPYCNGTGYLVVDQSVTTYGASGYKKKCDICGWEYWSSTAHSHHQCYHCHGTGHM